MWTNCTALVVLRPASKLRHVHLVLQFRNLTHGRLYVDDVALGPASSSAERPAVVAFRDPAACRVAELGRVAFAGGGAVPSPRDSSSVTACLHLSLDRLQHAVGARPTRACCRCQRTV